MPATQQYNGRLKIRLLERGITQKELAHKAKMPESHVSMLLNGKFIPKAQQQFRIAEILGCGVDEIF